jgi:hypothetical protein
MRYLLSIPLLILLRANTCQSFSLSSKASVSTSAAAERRIRRQPDTSLYQQNKKPEEEDGAVLTDVDARVLQDMLRDSKKLDLEQAENMKSLLERGIKAKERVNTNSSEENQQEEDSPFQSEILKKIGSTKLWKAFERKAEDWVESAKLYVSNRVERDAKLLASLGLFAFERAMQDVGRALPARSSSTWNPKKQFLLSNVTQAQQQQQQKDSIRQEMSTPSDEFQSVGRALKDIFRQTTVSSSKDDEKAVQAPPPKTPYSKNLNSATASSKYAVNDKERFQKVYQRKQQTTLKREKENVVQSSARIASDVADKAYQIKREVQAETSQPGYKTQAIREQTLETSRRFASGAKRILGGAKNLAAAALEATKQEDKMKTLKLSETSGYVKTPVAETTMERPNETRVPFTSTNFGSTTSPAPPLPSLEKLEMQDVLETEMETLVDRLTECIQNPQGTWLNPDLLLGREEEFISFPDDQLELVVVAMVQVQMMLQQPNSNDNEQTMISTLRLVQSSVDEMCDICLQVGSPAIADYLQQTLVYREVSDGQVPVLLQLDEYLAQLETLDAQQQRQQQASQQAMTEEAGNGYEPAQAVAAAPWFVDEDQADEPVQETKPWYVDDFIDSAVTLDDSFESPSMDSMSREAQVQEMELLDMAQGNPTPVVVVARETQVQEAEIIDAMPTSMRQMVMVLADDADSMRKVMAEIVTDDDFEVAMGQAKTVDKSIEGEYEDEEEDGEPNLVAMWALRSLDVVLLAGEKTVAVRL